MAQVTEPLEAIIVAHGSPSAPEPQERALARLARSVSDCLTGEMTLRSATLASEGALGRAGAGLSRPVIYPLFMTDGWFVRTALPRALAASGCTPAVVLPPFGNDPALALLAARVLQEEGRTRGWAPYDLCAVLAAHGSAKGGRAAAAAREAGDRIARAGGFADVRLGFLEERPYLQDVLAEAPRRSVCLPWLALEAGHARDDIPRAVETAAFDGPVLPPIGSHPEVPALIASALRAVREKGLAA